MKTNDWYKKIFGEVKIPVFVNITVDTTTPLRKSLEEIYVYENEKIDGVIIKSSYEDRFEAINVLKETKKINPNITIGINITPNRFDSAFKLAKTYGGAFIHLDYVSGIYTNGSPERVTFDSKYYEQDKNNYSAIIVLGGVWPKKYHPIPRSNLYNDILLAKNRVEAIVFTGNDALSEETSKVLTKIKEVVKKHPIIIDIGSNIENCYEQIKLSNGVIVDSCFKLEELSPLEIATDKKDLNEHFSKLKQRGTIDRDKLRDFMNIVYMARENFS